MTVTVSSQVLRLVKRKTQRWERDSIARAAFDRELIPDCNVMANFGRDFLFHESIPCSGNGHLAVVAAERVPKCMDIEGTLIVCGYAWSINSTSNHLQALWQGFSQDLVRRVYEETQQKYCIEPCGYRH